MVSPGVGGCRSGVGGGPRTRGRRRVPNPPTRMMAALPLVNGSSEGAGACTDLSWWWWCSCVCGVWSVVGEKYVEWCVQMAGMSLCREKVQRMKLACGPDRKQRTYIWQLRRGVKEQAWGGQLAGYMYKCAAWLPARSSLASRKRPRPRCARTKVDDPFPACAGHAPIPRPRPSLGPLPPRRRADVF